MAEVTSRPWPGTAADRAKAQTQRDAAGGGGEIAAPLCTASQSTASQSTDSQSTASQSTDSQSTASQSTDSQSTDSQSTVSQSTVSQSTVSQSDPTVRGTRPAVVLIGPPGSGKSSVGAAIARMTGLLMRDTDTDVERIAGRTIADIFVEDGEPRFRALERAAVAAALAEHPGVLALGGGAILAVETRAILTGHAVVFLNLSMPAGVRRTGLATNRPLLAGVNPRATYKALLDARLGLYRETARLEIATDQLTVTEVARTIIAEMDLE